VRVIEKVTVGKRGDGTLIRVEGQPNWFSLICVRGKQHEISSGTPDLKLAKRFHRQRLDELAADRQGLKQFTTPAHVRLQFGSLLDDLVSDYRVRRVKSLGSALSHIKPVRGHFGDWRAVDINDRGLHHQAPGGREVERNHQPGARASSSGSAARPRPSAAAVDPEGKGANRKQHPAGLLRAARSGSRRRCPSR
jgi:hypothetical protein